MSEPTLLPDSVETVPEMLAFWAERTPHAPAFIVPDDLVITYADLWHRTKAIAAALVGAGIRRQDRIAVLVPDGPALAVALLGASTAAIAVPLPVSFSALELTAALTHLRAAAAIVMPPLSATTRDFLTRYGVPYVALGGDGRILADCALKVTRWPRPAAVAVAIQTSGTTSTPKWAPSTHLGIVTIGRNRRDQFGLACHDRGLAVAPLTLSLGTAALFHNIAAGAALIFPTASDLPGLWAAIIEQRPTWMFPSAGLLELLARFLRANPGLPAPSSLRLVRVTAAPMSAELCEELANRLAAPVLNSYSSTEAGLVATALPPPASCRPGSVGRPVHEVRIVDGTDRDVGPGVDGEILVRGLKVFAGYLDDPEANTAAFTPDGWFRTGDVGHLDEDGFLYVTGRLKEQINRGGTKISPDEVDAVLMSHPAVKAAAAFALLDERLGQDIAAAVVLEDGAAVTPRDLRRWILDRLSPHKVPRRIWFVDDLPRTAAGKVQRYALTERFAAALSQPAAGG